MTLLITSDLHHSVGHYRVGVDSGISHLHEMEPEYLVPVGELLVTGERMVAMGVLKRRLAVP